MTTKTYLFLGTVDNKQKRSNKVYFTSKYKPKSFCLIESLEKRFEILLGDVRLMKSHAILETPFFLNQAFNSVLKNSRLLSQRRFQIIKRNNH